MHTYIEQDDNKFVVQLMSILVRLPPSFRDNAVCRTDIFHIVQSIYSLIQNNLHHKFVLLEIISELYPDQPPKSIHIYTS
jgi:hypothetical protein